MEARALAVDGERLDRIEVPHELGRHVLVAEGDDAVDQLGETLDVDVREA